MIYDLKFGDDIISFEVPSGWRSNAILPKHPERRDIEKTLLEAVSNPIGAEPLADWLQGKREILIIVSDVTRYTGADRVLPVLYNRFLQGCGVRVLFALGNHRTQTEAEKRNLVSNLLFDHVACIDHDCFEDRGLTSLGKTSSGLEIKVNSTLLEADGIIVTGSISFHYLAGFGGGRKAIFPGVSGYDTILGIHKCVFHKERPGKHEKAQSAVLGGNPMHEEMMQALSLLDKPLFLINTVFDDEKNFLNLFAGDMRAAHKTGCLWYSEHFEAPVREKADVVVVSAGGYPKDIDFIQTHKALEHAKGAAREGGTIVLLGKCTDGPGNAHFLRWFDYPTLEEMEPHVRESDKVYAQTAYSTRLKAERYHVILVSEMDEQDVKRMGITPVKTLQEALELTETNEELLCSVIPEGSKTLTR